MDDRCVVRGGSSLSALAPKADANRAFLANQDRDETRMSVEYAIHYATQGWPVFPLCPGGKTPLTDHGFKDATKDLEKVRSWWNQTPEANVGVVTGRDSGIIVVDIDRKNGIDGTIAAAELDLPRTFTVRTPSGGFHAVYSLPPNTIVPRKIGVKPGLDILGEGGYFVAPGSWVGNAVYAIVRNIPIAPCPQSIIELAQKSRIRQDGKIDADEAGRPHVQHGGRNDYLTRIGGQLRRIGFNADEMTAALLMVNTLRCSPPLGEAEVRRIASGLERYDPDDQAQTPGPLVIRSLTDLLSAEYPAPEFAIEPVLVHPGLAMIYGPTGVSKTFFVLGMGLAIASGHKWLKYTCTTKRGVLFVDGEMGNRALQDRIRKLKAGHEFTPAAFYTLTRDDQAGGVIPDFNGGGAQERFLACIPDNVEIIILDNLSTLTTENDGKDSNGWGSWDSMQALLLQLRRRGITAIIIHHANKGGIEQSGSEKKKHVMDTVISLRRHEPPEGQTPGFTETEVHIVKGRNLPPGMLEPYVATLSSPFAGTPAASGDLIWSSGELAPRKAAQIEEMLKMGMPVGQIVTELNCASSFAYRVKDRMVKAGLLAYENRKSGRKQKGRGEFQ
jgi:Bifunctional DNA primase/polymerase, N-terminal/AAA domain/Primase C terminal 1 (PriCT-1)